MTRSHIVRYWINDYRARGRISIRCWIHKRRPIRRPIGRAKGRPLWIFVRTLTALQRPRTVFDQLIADSNSPRNWDKLNDNIAITEQYPNDLVVYRLFMTFMVIYDVDISRPRQSGRHFTDGIFKCIFFNENIWISLNISLNFALKVRICNSSALVHIQYIPRNMHTVFALLCLVVVIHWLIFPYPPGLLHWRCGNLTIAPVPAKQPWWIWINTSCEFIMNDCITTAKQSTTKPCAYFLGYTVMAWTNDC